MRLVALARAPARVDVAARTLADVAGLAIAEARMRLAPEAPAVIARLEPQRADAVVAALRGAGEAALALDPATVPSDADRTVVRSLAVSGAGVAFTARSGARLELAWGELLAVLRGARSSRTDVERTEKSKRFSIGTALVTGGLVTTRTGTKTVRSSEEAIEQVILVYARDGRSAVLAQAEVEFSCLGPALQPSSTANMVELARMLREGAKGAFYDERLVRLGRRALPFGMSGGSRSQTATLTRTRADTAASLDVLAEVMRRALVEGLLADPDPGRS